jgi:hypothetical protein
VIAKLLWAGAILLLLAPSGWFAYRYVSMPHFGAFHDDAVYWTSAQALAQTQRYEIPYLPDHPAQVKYPPLYPAVLAPIWWIYPNFPENLRAASVVQWLFLPLLVWLAWLTFRRLGFAKVPSFAMTLLVAMSPITIVYSTSLMTEVPFAAAALATLLVVESNGRLTSRRALLAGILAAGTFLIRTNGIVLAATVCLLLLLGRQWRNAAWFTAPAAAAFLGWQWWCGQNALPLDDEVAVYYGGYVRFLLHTLSWQDLPARMFLNSTSLMESIGTLILYPPRTNVFIRMVCWVIAAGAISGGLLLFRRGQRHYAAFAAAFLLVLVIWPFPPGPRFVYPLLPLALAGLAVRLTVIGSLAVESLRRRNSTDRIAGAITVASICALIVACFAGSLHALAGEIPRSLSEREQQRSRMERVYSWIRHYTPERSVFAAYDDGLLYAYTGRVGRTISLLPARWYGQDAENLDKYLKRTHQGWHLRGVTHVLVTDFDFQRDLSKPAVSAMKNLVADRSCFHPEYQDPAATVYRLLPGCLQREDLLTNRIERQPPLLHVRDIP